MLNSCVRGERTECSAKPRGSRRSVSLRIAVPLPAASQPDEGDIPERYKERVSDYFKRLSDAEGSR